MEVVAEDEAKEEAVQEIEPPEAKIPDNIEQSKEEDNVESEAIASRRVSQNSENNANEQSDNVTPTQTDDNEEVSNFFVGFFVLI